MDNPKDIINKYWVDCINQLLSKLGLEEIEENSLIHFTIFSQGSNRGSTKLYIYTKTQMLSISYNKGKITSSDWLPLR